MKIRKAKKQIKKCLGFMSANGYPVFNCVTNSDYTGGSCAKLDEDCYRIEIEYTRKRYGAPMVIDSVGYKLFCKIHGIG
jgi:hypothetical protein